MEVDEDKDEVEDIGVERTTRREENEESGVKLPRRFSTDKISRES